MEQMVKLYDEFVDKMDKGLASAQDAAECQARIVQLYPNIAKELRNATKAYNEEQNRLMQTTDEATNKPMTAAKADKLVDGGPLGMALTDAKTEADVYENLKYTLKDYMVSLSKEWNNT